MSPGAPLERILLVDDDPHLLKFTALALRSYGRFVVEPLGDPFAAVPRALDFAPDLALLDLFMPGCDGLQIHAAFRAEPVTAALPVVFLTGNARAFTPPEDPTVLGVIGKPFRPTELPNRILDLWRRRA